MSREGFALLAMLSVTTGASAYAVLALDSYGIIEIVPKQRSIALSQPLPKSTLTADDTSLNTEPAAPLAAEVSPAPTGDVSHFSYVPAAAGPLRLASYTEETTDEVAEATDEPTDVDDQADEVSPSPESWSAEIRSEPKRPVSSRGPRLAGLSTPHLPGVGRSVAEAAAKASLKQRLAEISPGANQRLAQKFETAAAAWPPANIALVGIKDEKVLDLYARPNGGKWKHIYRYPVLASSGVSGPKLRQGDKQVPEGIYGITLLNPNSRFHVSMRVNYPNSFDRQMAQRDGRKNLGGDIMIHGKNASIGCLAVGDEAAEELFVLADRIGLKNIKLIIAPTDFRKNGIPAVDEAQPKWVPALYTQVASAMTEFEAPPSNSLLSFFWK